MKSTRKIVRELTMKAQYRLLAAVLGVVWLLGVGSAVPGLAQSFTPELLKGRVNSDCPEVNPVLSKGGDTLFFSRVNCDSNRYGREDSQDIYMSVRQSDDTWGAPVRLHNSVNIGRYNALYSVLSDGRTFLIGGCFDKNGKTWLRNGFSLATLGDDGIWSAPRRLKVSGYSSLDEGRYANAYMTPDGRFLFMTFSSMWNGGNLKLYISEKKREGVYTRPKRMRGVFKEFASVEAPHYSQSGNKLYFSGRKRGSSRVRLYYAVPSDSTLMRWDTVVSLSDTVNIGSWTSYFVPNHDATYALLCAVGGEQAAQERAKAESAASGQTGSVEQSESVSDVLYPGDSVRAGSIEVRRAVADSLGGLHEESKQLDLAQVEGKSHGRSDIYQAMLVETRPWVDIKGRLIDGRTRKLLKSESKPEVYVNGAQSDSVKMVDGNRFTARLPLGGVYAFSAAVPYYTSDTVQVDVHGIKLHQERVVDITMTTLPYVRVYGVILDSYTSAPIERKWGPKLLIDGKTVDSVELDPKTMAYAVNLPFGSKYTFSVQANEYKPVPVEVDLSMYDSYGELEQNVYASPLNPNMVTLYGKVINTKTGKPLEPGIVVTMRVNRHESNNFQYNDKNASYRLMLPAGSDYDLVPNAKNFYNRLEVVDLKNAKPRAKVPRDFFVTPLEVGQSVDIENIYFETGKSNLKPESFRSLNALVDFFNEYPNVRVLIGGHTDNVGGKAMNIRLSGRRAAAVAQYLIDQGISRDRFVTKGYGPERPKVSNKTAKGRAQNRRVDFTIEAI